MPVEEVLQRLDEVDVGVFVLDGGWRYSYLNAAAESLVRRPRGTLRGKVIWDEFPAVVGSRIEAEYRRVMSERVTSTLREYYPELGRWYEISVLPQGDHSITVLFVDVTEAHEVITLLALYGTALVGVTAGA